LGKAPTQTGLGWRGWLALAAALFLLNLALSFEGLSPTPFIRPAAQVSVEIALVILGLALWAGLRGPPPGALLATLALALTLLTLGRYVAVTAQGVLGRPLDLYWDLPHLPNVTAMLLESVPLGATAAALAGAVLGAALIYLALRWALGQVGHGVGCRRPGRVLGLGSATLLAVYLGGQLSPGLPGSGWFAAPVSLIYADQAGLWVEAPASNVALPADRPASESDLGRLGGAHLVLVFLESYGALVYDRPGLQERVAAAHAELARAVSESGRGAVSALVHAPTYGGYSWLSHASLLAGIEVRDNATYTELLTETRETLVHRFARQGYRALAMMPGLREDWPEGAFYGFDLIYGAAALDYRGPELGWWRIPDQFAAARLEEGELGAQDGVSRFVFFPTISTHAPFRPTPPYEPDWGRVLGATPFDQAELAAALAVRPNYKDLSSDYADAMAYAFSWLAGWLRQAEGADWVLLVIGDHQPPASVGGREASNEVPSTSSPTAATCSTHWSLRASGAA
jgi:hypothetical protein